MGRWGVRRKLALAAAIVAAGGAVLGGPLFIGISDSCGSSKGKSRISRNHDYLESVRKAGHVPVLVPQTADTNALAQIVARLDALILTGGEDIDPRRYREKPIPELGKVAPARDAFDFALMDAALARKLPVLGICRGCQLINVYFGGTLWQDLPSQFPAKRKLLHRQKISSEKPHHGLEIVSGSRFAKAIGATRARVNSLHHQAVRDVAPGFRVTARSSDGVIEAIEGETVPVLGVQFHPERLYAQGGMREFEPIFKRLVEVVTP